MNETILLGMTSSTQVIERVLDQKIRKTQGR